MSKPPITQIDKATALRLYNGLWWRHQGAVRIVAFQLFQDRLCIPFEIYQAALNAALGRQVHVHELDSNNIENVRQEFLKQSTPGTLEEIMEDDK